MDTRSRVARVLAVAAGIAAASVIAGIGLLVLAIEFEFDNDVFGAEFPSASSRLR